MYGQGLLRGVVEAAGASGLVPLVGGGVTSFGTQDDESASERAGADETSPDSGQDAQKIRPQTGGMAGSVMIPVGQTDQSGPKVLRRDDPAVQEWLKKRIDELAALEMKKFRFKMFTEGHSVGRLGAVSPLSEEEEKRYEELIYILRNFRDGNIGLLDDGRIVALNETGKKFMDWLARRQWNNDDSGTRPGQPGLVEGAIPIWGPGRAGIDDLWQGNYVTGILELMLAGTDVVLVGALIRAGARAIGGAAARESGDAALKGKPNNAPGVEPGAKPQPRAELPKPNAAIINQIKALPDGAKLTPEQIVELSKNVDVILLITLPEKAKHGNLQWVIDLFKRDPRFRFLDQVPGAVERIEEALRKYGGTLK